VVEGEAMTEIDPKLLDNLATWYRHWCANDLGGSTPRDGLENAIEAILEETGWAWWIKKPAPLPPDQYEENLLAHGVVR
jgi:hypothetical protein